MWWVLSGWLLGMPALAGAKEDIELSKEEREAEYRRLRHDLTRYGEKSMWTAVERTYSRCLELYPDDSAAGQAWAPPTPMEQQDHLFAAHAATSRGDLLSTRRRVERALRKEETAEAMDWLWAIDTTYTEVEIRAPVGTSLTPSTWPFDPVISSAIRFGNTQLQETGVFHGLLPRMAYTVGETPFEVWGGKGKLALDLGGSAASEKKKRRKKKRRR